MDYTCENQQHFVWGTRLRLKDSKGKVKTVDVTNKMKADGFKMAEEGYPAGEDGSWKPLVPGEEPTDEERGPAEESPVSER